MHNSFTPLMTQKIFMKRLKSGRSIIEEETGLNKFCGGCGEYWPQDTLFFDQSNTDATGLASWCKACKAERKRNRLKRGCQ